VVPDGDGVVALLRLADLCLADINEKGESSEVIEVANLPEPLVLLGTFLPRSLVIKVANPISFPTNLALSMSSWAWRCPLLPIRDLLGFKLLSGARMCVYPRSNMFLNKRFVKVTKMVKPRTPLLGCPRLVVHQFVLVVNVHINPVGQRERVLVNRSDLEVGDLLAECEEYDIPLELRDLLLKFLVVALLASRGGMYLACTWQKSASRAAFMASATTPGRMFRHQSRERIPSAFP